MMEIKKLDNRGSWRRGKTFHNFTHCESCGGQFDGIKVKYQAKGLCKPCYNKKWLSNNIKKNKLYQKPYIDSDLMSKEECMGWIAKRYDKKLFVGIKELNELILVYESLGGKQQELDLFRSGEQLQRMWNYVNNIFLKEYKDVLKLNI